MDFIKLLKYMNLSYEYKRLLREKKENEKKEKLAAIVIQKYYRGYKERRIYLIYKYFLKYIKNKIELCSCKYLLKKLKKQKLEQQIILHMSDNAIKIQKTFRGFYSRKYIHDFFKRKRQIIEINNYVNEQKSKMLLELEEKRKNQLLYENKLKDTKMHKVAKNLHHLVSTKAQRGIYNLKIENIIKEQQEKIKKKDKKYTKK
ncbi:conserved Plasmodium protein, unknown function [Plasmodium relictum]|uniref:Calmodulin binding protein n=1 Tax=Plasmodium relictum TaxID=85471 RepID=A0A1J1H5E2_PLARL|nr:conserved Plasmodium protein, unknown function [Plasmodium relictum]CRG99978.1 conserved Plasmodium protein, unknown function [Plasmodium relictum]